MRRPLPLLLVLAACGGGTPEPQPAPTAAPVDAAPAQRDDLVILSPGEKPRHQLRYRLAAGTRRATEFAMEMAMETGGQQVTFPLVTFTGTVVVTDVSASGDTSLAWSFADAAIADDGSVDPAVRKLLDDMAAAVVDVEFTSLFSELGATLTAQKVETADMNQAIENVSQSTTALVVGLPDAAVGRGARWVVQSKQARGGLLFDVSSEIEIVEVTATTLHYRARSVFTAPLAERTTPMGTLPTEGTGRGRSEMTIDLTTLEAECVSEVAMTVQVHFADRGPVSMDLGYRTLQRVR